MLRKESHVGERLLFLALIISLVCGGMLVVRNNSHTTAKIDLSRDVAEDDRPQVPDK